ncbi:uncharacterized protein LOC143366630 [Andrena cerasifolii]|uniref:uncharacterized protein LOC143366630 n=1 Tax=Andrena cerasifolii TaxID=2819439 RepID=UPI004037B929
MNPSQWNLVSMVMLLICTGCLASYRQQKRHVPMARVSQSSKLPPYWEHILREFVFKTISSPPPGNNDLYRRLLEAPFYGGPFPTVTNYMASLVLSRGDVYYLPNGNWLLCQEGCIDCDACTGHTQPTIKWVLRRIKRLPPHGPQRHDLQLTIIPQIDGSYHMNALWPRSYVYVTTQSDLDAYLSDKPGYGASGSAYGNLQDSLSGQGRKSTSFWRFVERESLPEQRVSGGRSNGTDPAQPSGSDPPANVSTTATPSTETSVTQDSLKNSSGQHARVKSADRQNDSTPVVFSEDEISGMNQMMPKLILGTDQFGQKHLVHVVPADSSSNANFTDLVLSGPVNLAGQYQSTGAYQKLLRRIYDSLSSNKRSIESFLEPLIRAEMASQRAEDYQQQETRYSFTGLGQAGGLRGGSNGGIRNAFTMHKRWPLTLNWDRQRRKSSDDTDAGGFISNSIGANRASTNSHDFYRKIRNININSTFSPYRKNGNVSGRVNFKPIDRNYYSGNAFNSNTGASNARRRGQRQKFGPRKFKMVVTTESTAKPSNNSGGIRNRKLRNVNGGNL